jgi:LytS/YehU family sensor histidine kinase
VGFSFSDPSIPLAVAAVWFPLGLLLAAQLHRSQLEREAEARLRVLLKEVRVTQQQHSEARLRMLQSRIDPTLLFGMLERVRALYEKAPERAEMLLEELIVFLRAVLPRLHSAASTVGQEIAAAAAYVRLRALADGQAGAIEVDPGAAFDQPFPPGVLLPLVGGVLEQGAGKASLGMTVAVGERDSELVLTSTVAPPEAGLAQARRVLADLYGGRAELVLWRAEDGHRIAIRVPHERH